MGARITIAFLALLHEAAQLVPRTETSGGGFRFLRSDEHDIVQTVVVEASDGFEIAGERFTAACVEGSDEMLGGLFCDFLDSF
jgi:hypothetical protein